MQEIIEWMADIGFAEYAEGVISQGWDDLDLLRIELLSGDADRVLLDAGVEKGGHRAKIRYVAAIDSSNNGLTLEGTGKLPSATSMMYLGDAGLAPTRTPRSCADGNMAPAAAAAAASSLWQRRRSTGGFDGASPTGGRRAAAASRIRGASVSPVRQSLPRAGSASARKQLWVSQGLTARGDTLASDSDDDGGGGGLFYPTGRSQWIQPDGATAVVAVVPRGTARRRKRGSRRGKGRAAAAAPASSARIQRLVADEKRLRKFMTQYIYSPHLV